MPLLPRPNYSAMHSAPATKRFKPMTVTIFTPQLLAVQRRYYEHLAQTAASLYFSPTPPIKL